MNNLELLFIVSASSISALMDTQISQRKQIAGFTLVEIAIALLILGILLSAGLSLATVRRAAAQRDVTQINQQAIKQALINYLGKNHRLPCPATTVDGAENRAGTTPPPCAQYSGIVPYQELGLDRTVALDGWENFISYVVSPYPNANPPTQPAAPAPLLTTGWLYTYSSTPTTTPCTTTLCSNYHTPANPGTIVAGSNMPFWPSTSTGGIKVTDGTTTLADPAIATGAAVVLISFGKNGYGAYNLKGQNAPPPAANTDEIKNAANTVATAAVIKRDTTDSVSGGGPFDDIVMIISANDLTGPLVANGSMQTSAQTAINQANDMVIGNILASRSCTTTPTGCAQYSANPVCTSFALTCTTYDTSTPPNCIAYGNVCTAYSTPSASCTSQTYTNVCSYNVPTSITFSAPPNVAAWGVGYTQGATATMTIFATTFTPTTALFAYTLTAGDGSVKTVSISELQGTLTRAAGFN
jgi:prepilin-type N-terminal cleavage/methylation domain-containing protein